MRPAHRYEEFRDVLAAAEHQLVGQPTGEPDARSAASHLR
jgi:hypothetical protein